MRFRIFNDYEGRGLRNMDIYIICKYFSMFSYADSWWTELALLATFSACSVANAPFCIYHVRLKSVKAILIYPLFIFG
ncbi:hypothetical protein [Plasmodium yoelii yoelii]|uniref:Uncharacterized protein n=1 Tax=Plasmodium yoelii yoelii TaxID=73239 RepID=Q7RET1_PLAYO|nr:hypothetical protein [Plasmodium yoelii yoelii]